jgi:hypothetical protein
MPTGYATARFGLGFLSAVGWILILGGIGALLPSFALLEHMAYLTVFSV